MSQPIHLTDSNFTDEIKNSEVPVVVDFWAAWCGPCRMIAPIIDELATEYEGKAKITKVDVDNNQQVAMQYGIRSIPTILMFKGGEQVETIVGAVPKEEIQKKATPDLNIARQALKEAKAAASEIKTAEPKMDDADSLQMPPE